MTDMHSARSWLVTVVASPGLAHFPARMTRQRRFDQGRRPWASSRRSPRLIRLGGGHAAAAASWSTPSPLPQPHRRVPAVPAGVRAGDRNHRMVRPLPGSPKRPAQGTGDLEKHRARCAHALNPPAGSPRHKPEEPAFGPVRECARSAGPCRQGRWESAARTSQASPPPGSRSGRRPAGPYAAAFAAGHAAGGL